MVLLSETVTFLGGGCFFYVLRDGRSLQERRETERSECRSLLKKIFWEIFENLRKNA